MKTATQLEVSSPLLSMSWGYNPHEEEDLYNE